VPILQRLVVEFDRQLVEVAVRRESELAQMRIAIYRDHLDQAGTPTRSFELHSDPTLSPPLKQKARQGQWVMPRGNKVSAFEDSLQGDEAGSRIAARCFRSERGENGTKRGRKSRC
jgi:hypothetical protein